MHRVCDVAHADFVNEFLDEANHPEIMTVILRPYQPRLCTGENLRQEGQTPDEGILLPPRDSSAEPMKGAVKAMRIAPVTDAVHPPIPVPRPPVFDHIEAAGFQVIVEQVPEAYSCEDANMSAVVDDDVKTIWSRLAPYTVEQLRIFL